MTEQRSTSISRGISPGISMTGFGSAEGELAGQRFRLEIRTVNHRFLDIKLRLPRELQVFDTQLRQLLQTALSRGSVDCKLERSLGDAQNSMAQSEKAPRVLLDLDRAREVHSALQKLREELQIAQPISLQDVARFDSVLRTEETSSLASEFSSPQRLEDFWTKHLAPLARKAIGELREMRAREGSALTTVLTQGMHEIQNSIAQVQSARAKSEQELKSRLTEKLRRILDAFPLQPTPTQALLETRLAQELTVALERTDIQEELHRFEGHIAHFHKTLSEGQQLGRKLEFLLQELGREINTLGNKAQDLGISQLVVAIKVKLEQLREQVLNLE